MHHNSNEPLTLFTVSYWRLQRGPARLMLLGANLSVGQTLRAEELSTATHRSTGRWMEVQVVELERRGAVTHATLVRVPARASA